ncbi:Uncharacterized protein FWK35_00026701 [Aphis craccivora]|uniref:Uncharacterized protein n=1 Tax=Aphis craccivora TaxID=307492 RepID=A0A6G0X1B8_APHCR|nr:Uncharacterized protein FWK35_00026701 [Aphis craccivora]
MSNKFSEWSNSVQQMKHEFCSETCENKNNYEFQLLVNRRRTNDQQRQQVHRACIYDSFLRLAFQYEPDIEYYAHSKVVIGAIDKEFPHCH